MHGVSFYLCVGLFIRRDYCELVHAFCQRPRGVGCNSSNCVGNRCLLTVWLHFSDWHKKLLVLQEAVASTSISGARINSHMTADQQAESLKFQRRPKFLVRFHRTYAMYQLVIFSCIFVGMYSSRCLPRR